MIFSKINYGNMKNYVGKGIGLYTILVISSLIVFGGCKDFVNLSPLDEANVENSFQSPDDINQGVLGVYDALQSGNYAQNMAVLTELITDNAYTQNQNLQASGSGDLREMAYFELTSSNGHVESRWNSLYNGISRANLVIGQVQEVDFSDQGIKDQYIGEAKFLRALFYFDLVRFFGAVPVSLSNINSADEAFALGRTPVEEVYSEVIVADLEEAIQLLPKSYNSGQLGRATEGAAKALLSKVHLTQGNADLAIPLLQELTNNYDYRLTDNYSGVFEGDNTRESIFEIQYTSSDPNEGNPYPNWFLPVDGSAGTDVFGQDFAGGTGGTGSVLISPDLFNSYENNGPRRDYTAAEYESSLEDSVIYRVNKYREPPTNPQNSEDNIIVLRYADVLLMLAEALNEVNNGPISEAYNAADKVRVRAGLDRLERNLSYESFKTKLLEERRKEFAFENKRWFDLKRLDKAVEILSNKGYAIEEHHLLYPLPRLEVEINSNIQQNPGY
jgi:hypothetical protein